MNSLSPSAAASVTGAWGRPLAASDACSPERRPKTSVSSSELAPRRLPPWTLTQAASPAEYRPRTGVSPSTLVLTPPIW